MARLRFITNAFTRLRFCTPDGRLAMREKGAPGSQNNGSMPWFQVPKRATRHDRILFGHWSTLGYREDGNTWCLDSGCLWGGSLTALKLRKSGKPQPLHFSCPGVLKPGKK